MSHSTPPPDTPDDLENFIHRTLRAQPEASAPASLEARVLARLAAAAPGTVAGETAAVSVPLNYSRARWAGWPPLVKGLFVSGATAALLAVFQLLLVARSRVSAEAEAPLSLVTELARTTWRVASLLIDSIPAPWLYAGAFALAAGHLALFGVGSLFLRALRSLAATSS